MLILFGLHVEKLPTDWGRCSYTSDEETVDPGNVLRTEDLGRIGKIRSASAVTDSRRSPRSSWPKAGMFARMTSDGSDRVSQGEIDKITSLKKIPNRCVFWSYSSRQQLLCSFAGTPGVILHTFLVDLCIIAITRFDQQAWYTGGKAERQKSIKTRIS